MKRQILLFAAATLTSTAAFSQTGAPAFPGAEGHGRYVTGGRGGEVRVVTTLEDTGKEGSLRWAVKGNDPKIIVFNVGGTIFLNKDLEIGSNTTIAGQTAPGSGITICYYTVDLTKCDNVIMRFIRIRRGNGKNVNDGADAAWGRRRKNIIIDHCSFSWSIDECASFYDNQNFTLQWCTVAESLNYAGHNKGAHGYGGIWGGKSASFHHNLLAHHNNRSPRLNGARYGWLPEKGAAATTEDEINQSINEEQVDYRNCVIYNWGQGNGAYGGMGGYHNIVNNYYKYGPATKNKDRIFEADPTEGKDDEALPAGIYGHFYVNGNYVRDKGDNYDWAGIYVKNGSESDVKLNEPIETGDITTHDAETAFNKVLAFAGASLVRDVYDERYSEEAETGTTTYIGTVTEYKNEDDQTVKVEKHYKGLIDSQDETEGYPETNLVERPAGFDSDGDGMPDEWETLNDLNPNDLSDASLKTVDTKGWYTNIEVYANSLVENIVKAQNADGESNYEEYYPECESTGIEDITAGASEVEKIEYYTLGGMKLSEPVKGINIRKITFTNGKTATDKVIK